MSHQFQTAKGLEADRAACGTDARVLLTEVAFKWLMAGQGWWIDTTRLHADPSYAARFVRLALTSQSPALRECAAVLQGQIGDPAR